jgi:hypothetical protein
MTITPFTTSQIIGHGNQIFSLKEDLENHFTMHGIPGGGNVVYVIRGTNPIQYVNQVGVDRLIEDYCKLEFFYYYDDDAGYENAIWVRINDNPNRWLYLGQSKTGRRKACISSTTNFHHPNFDQQYQKQFTLPSPAIGTPTGFLGQPSCHEHKKPTRNPSIIQKIEERLPVVC